MRWQAETTRNISANAFPEQLAGWEESQGSRRLNPAVALPLKLHLHCDLHGNRLAVFLGGLKLPLLHGLDRALFEGLLVAAENAHRLNVSFGIHAHQHDNDSVPLRVGRQIWELRSE